MKPNIVVGRRRNWQPVLVTLAAVAAVMLAPVLYGLARSTSWERAGGLEQKLEGLEADRSRLARELRNAQARNDKLEQEVADLRRGREIDRQAWSEVQKSLSDEQQEAANLREQLAFYRGVVSPQALRSGLHVNTLRVSRGSAPDSYQFDLVLVQAARQDRRARGRAELRFIGRDRSSQRSLALADLIQDGRSSLPFAFRHFQEFEGELRFPSGFRPEKAIVTLIPEGGDSPHVVEEFEWGKIRDKTLAERPG